MRNENSVSLGVGGECFDIPTPVLLFPAIYGHVICCLWFLHSCAKNVELFSVVFTCRLDILAKWTVFMITRTYQRLELLLGADVLL